MHIALVAGDHFSIFQSTLLFFCGYLQLLEASFEGTVKRTPLFITIADYIV